MLVYNLVELPEIPAGVYEHQYITDLRDFPQIGGYLLTVSDTAASYVDDTSGVAVPAGANVKQYQVEDGAWALYKELPGALVQYTIADASGYDVELVWCNTNVMKGTEIYLAASEPKTADKYSILKATLEAIADAIREKLGVADKQMPKEMPGLIRSIQGEQQPTVTNIDYSSWASGSFKETLDNGSTLEYAVEFDGDKPIKVTTPTGEEVTVELPVEGGAD